MPKPRVDAAGGLAAIRYTLRKGRDAGGVLRLYRRLRSRNTCKTCALGMGGQKGGMVNEQRSFPEVCKKSIQAAAGDMQKPIEPSFFRDHSIQELEGWSPRQLEYAGRLAFPIVWNEGDTHFTPIGWDHALDRIAADLKSSAPDETFFYGSGRSSNEAAFLMQVFARSYGTANIHNCSSYCHNASSVALSRIFGTPTGTVTLDDLDRADLALVAGANPASNHPRLITKLVELRERGGTVIVVNPLRELGLVRFRIPSRPGSLLRGSDVSDIYLQPHIGSDVAVFKALLKGVIEGGGLDREYVRDHVEGWDAVEADIQRSEWRDLLTTSGLSRDQVDRAAEAITRAKHGLFLWAMGLTHHEHGVTNVTALANLALARGFVGRSGSGLLPIRGHSNVQGVGSMGFTHALKAAFAAKMEEVYGIPSSARGLDTYSSMEAARHGRIRTAVLLGGNLFSANPDRVWARSALHKIGTTAYFTTTLNEGHVHGRGRCHLVLPVLARDEETQSTTQESMFNFVRLSVGGETAPSRDVRSEVETVCALAARVLPEGPFPFERMKDHNAVREAIARVVPGYEEIERIGATTREFHVQGRVLHDAHFPTASGKACAAVTPLSAFGVADGEFRLMTLRSEGQFNTVVYEEEDLYRGNDRRDVVMMNEEDARRLQVGEGDPVVVATAVGEMRVVVAFAGLPPGNLAMYYPEANILVPRRIDPLSGTPAFKSVAARITNVLV